MVSFHWQFSAYYISHNELTDFVPYIHICWFNMFRFKNNGENFHVKLPAKEKLINPNVVVPEDLVQIQAYLRWERKGKQMYSPEQEKVSVLKVTLLYQLISFGNLWENHLSHLHMDLDHNKLDYMSFCAIIS